jgi:hypothetical protein
MSSAPSATMKKKTIYRRKPKTKSAFSSANRKRLLKFIISLLR